MEKKYVFYYLYRTVHKPFIHDKYSCVRSVQYANKIRIYLILI